MVVENLQINLIRERFLKLNKERIERTQQLMLSTQRDFLELLPLLFHVNNSLLPGFVTEKTPSGIYNYILNDKLLGVAKRQWPGVEFSKRGAWQHDIEALFLMGSCGTVAFTRKSDFDVWLCHRPDLSASDLEALQKKSDRIEQWFDTVGMEVHFFLMNAVAFKKGEVAKLSSESSGTAQHRLLLDEFYRANIWLGGKVPFWWFVPPEKEVSYKQMYDQLTSTEVLSESEVIDFGGLPDIPTSEFFGAAVWQIYKGIDSPYKSILKITLMESYAGSYPKSTPLSAEFKQHVYDDIDDLVLLDPYLSMLQRLETHLNNIKESARLEVIRRSFYLKLNISLSNTYEKDNWRKILIKELVTKWKWSAATIQHLDDKKSWRLEQVSGERKLLMMHLTKSYGFLSAFARKHAKDHLIDQKDLSVLGRKLYSVFERKPGKVEIFNRGIVDSIREESITLILLSGKDGKDVWRLYRGRVTGEQFKNKKHLKQTFSIIEMIAWMHFNQLISDTTQKLLYAPGSEVNINEFNVLLGILDKISEAKKRMKSEAKAFLKSPTIEKNLVFLNVGKPANIRSNTPDKKLISGEIDVLNYGAKTECLVQTIDYCYVNSWREIFVFKYYGVEGVAQFICDLLGEYYVTYKMNSSKEGFDILSNSPEVQSFSTHISHVLSSRFSSLINSAISICLSSNNINFYVYEVGKKLYCIHNDKGRFRFSRYDSTELLMEHMSNSGSDFLSVAFDDVTLQGHVLKTVYARNKQNVIQIFLLRGKSAISIYVLDESGVLFSQKMPNDAIEIVGQHFFDFIQTIVNKTQLRGGQIMESVDESETIDKVETYVLTKKQYHFKATPVSFSEKNSIIPYGVQVIGDIVDQITVFKFYCDDAEFSTVESGSEIFDVVAKHILKQRQVGEKYHVYITDLDLSSSLIGRSSTHSVQIVKYLKYKKNIEGKLNKALVNL